METLREYVTSGPGCKVDRQNGVIRGVKVLGLESRNGRTYKAEALRQAAKLYESAKVNVNHPKGNPNGTRDYQDRIGQLRGVTMRDGGLYADLHFNPKHALAEQLIWDAEHAPEAVGLSHNVEARTGRGAGGRVVVEEITRVQSVDLVADPATTRGLFEETDPIAAKRALVESVAAEIGLPKWCIPPLDGGLSYHESRAEVRDYLRTIKEGLMRNGTIPPQVENSLEFTQFVTTGSLTTQDDKKAFAEALGVPYKPEPGKTGAQTLVERIF